MQMPCSAGLARGVLGAAMSSLVGWEQGSPFRFPVKSRCLPETEFRSEISVNFGEFRWISDEIC